MAARLLDSRHLWSLLRPSLLSARLSKPSPPSVAVCVRAEHSSDHLLAALLSQTPPHPVHILCPPTSVPFLRTLSPSASIHPIPPDQTLRPYAAWALRNHVAHLVLGHTRVDAATHALTSNHAAYSSTLPTPYATGIEMLPPRTFAIHTPLHEVHTPLLDRTIAHVLPPQPTADSPLSATPTDAARAAHLFGPDPDLDAILRHGARKRHLVDTLSEASADLLRRAVLEASHWGYIVARRSTLAAHFYDAHPGRLVALHAIARMALHVSGSADHLTLDDENIARLADDLLAVDRSTNQLVPLPKGRTAAGIVVRPATGRFAKRLAQADRRALRHRPRERAKSLVDAFRTDFRDCPDDLMIFTREPDQESGPLKSRRLRGNWSSLPIPTDTDGAGVYWDNRFVMSAAPITNLDEGHPPISPTDVMLAALRAQDEQLQSALTDTELYVRQIRRVDWERITSSVSRVKGFQIPFQCIRALPAVFQKVPGASTAGHLVASPHLGLSGRPDLYFTAVRMPRYRCLPEDIDPGFTEEHFQPDDQLQDTKRQGSQRTSPRKRAPAEVEGTE